MTTKVVPSTWEQLSLPFAWQCSIRKMVRPTIENGGLYPIISCYPVYSFTAQCRLKASMTSVSVSQPVEFNHSVGPSPIHSLNHSWNCMDVYIYKPLLLSSHLLTQHSISPFSNLFITEHSTVQSISTSVSYSILWQEDIVLHAAVLVLFCWHFKWLTAMITHTESVLTFELRNDLLLSPNWFFHQTCHKAMLTRGIVFCVVGLRERPMSCRFCWRRGPISRLQTTMDGLPCTLHPGRYVIQRCVKMRIGHVGIPSCLHSWLSANTECAPTIQRNGRSDNTSLLSTRWHTSTPNCIAGDDATHA